MKLYNYHQNSAGERVRIALHLKCVPYEYVSVPDLDEHFRQINPQSLLPALVVDNHVIAQSNAILDYLDATFPTPPLLPGNAMLRAQAIAFSQHIACDLHPLITLRVRRHLAERFSADQEAIRTWCITWMEATFLALEETLARRRVPYSFCFSEEPGLAEIHLVPQIRNARLLGCDVDCHRRLVAVEQNCIGLDAFRLARPDSQPDAPRSVETSKLSLPAKN